MIEGLTRQQMPKAFNDDRVFVHNYKKKKKDANGNMIDANAWEWATVESVRTGWYRNPETGIISYRHAYDVVLERQTKNKWGEWVSALRLTVNDDGLQTITGE